MIQAEILGMFFRYLRRVFDRDRLGKRTRSDSDVCSVNIVSQLDASRFRNSVQGNLVNMNEQKEREKWS